MKKVLIITYYWPPSGGGGVQRWLKFAKYLPKYGIEPIIFTPENPDFSTKDPSLLAEVDPDLEVIKLPIWEPYQLFEKISGKKTPAQGLVSSGKKRSWITNLALWVRGNFFIPDPRKFWIKPSIKFLLDIIERNEIDTIITTGPPHSMHLIGLGIKKKLDVRWIADFRDPWSNWDMLDNFKLSSLAKEKHKRLERNVLLQADEVITVSDSWAHDFERLVKRDYHVITNGFDTDDFKEYNTQVSSSSFVISHFGLLNNFRNPKNFWKAVKKIVGKKEITVRLYGMIEETIVNDIQTDPILNKIVDMRSSVSHEEVIKAYAESDLLLLLLNDSKNAKGHIPGKLFEYIASKRPILAIGPENSDAANIIKSVNAGEIKSTTDNLDETLNMFISKPQYNQANSAEKYTREQLTKELVDRVLLPLESISNQ